MSDIHQRMLALEEELVHLKAQLARERAWIRQVIPSKAMVTAGAKVLEQHWLQYNTSETTARLVYIAMIEAAEVDTDDHSGLR